MLTPLPKGHRELASQNQNLFGLIAERVRSLTRSPLDSATASLARDTLQLLEVRSSVERVFNTPASDSNSYESSRNQFKEAADLLQDPILPIKAQGIDVLKRLIKSDPDRVDPVVWPEITGLLLNAIGNDDSFIYQRAVQCITELCLVSPHTQGVGIARDLVKLYSDKPEAILVPTDLDRRLRYGEVLDGLVEASGAALALYGEFNLPFEPN